MSNRTQVENLIDRLCNLDDQYTRRIHQGTLTPAIRKLILRQIDTLETKMWNLDMNREDLEWFANRPIYQRLQDIAPHTLTSDRDKTDIHP